MVHNKSSLLSKDYIKLTCAMYMSLSFVSSDKDLCSSSSSCVLRRANMIKIVWGQSENNMKTFMRV